MTTFESPERFHRPDDLKVLRRNRRQIQAERLLAIAGRILFVFLLTMLTYWIVLRVRQGPRFAVKQIEWSGVRHTSRADLRKIDAAYAGRNLFELDLDRIQRDLRSLPWVQSVSIEKQLPSVLKIAVVERKPVALTNVNGAIRYVDERGVPFADLSPEIGNPDLPLIGGRGRDAEACVNLLVDLKERHPELYSRISEISPAGENGFAIFDRDLKTTVYIDAASAADKWLTLYAISDAEKLRRRPAEYVDLRFTNRIIVKPQLPVAGSQLSVPRAPTTGNRQPTTGESR